MSEPPLPSAPQWLTRVAEATAEATTTNDLVGALLTLLQQLTGLESTYLTRIHWDRGVQEILTSLNAGSLRIDEGLEVPWSDTLCRRAMAEDVPWASDVPDRWGDSDAARELGIQTYVSVPVVLDPAEAPWGTLCGIAAVPREEDEGVVATLHLFSRLIGQALREDAEARRAAERVVEVERQLRASTEVVAAAEHAMKAPAGSVLMWAQTLLQRWDQLDEAQVREGLERIHGAAERLLAQLRDLVDKARGDLLAAEVVLRETEISTVVAAVVQELEAPTHPVTIVGDELVADTDPAVLRLVLEHLLDNVRAHTPVGTNVTITTRRDREQAVVEIRDDGPGLPEGIDIFEPFRRGNLENVHGTGLGLAIVRTLVETLQGTVEATTDGGAVMTVRLPLG